MNMISLRILSPIHHMPHITSSKTALFENLLPILKENANVDDALDGIAQTINLQSKGFHTFNISSSVRYSIKDIVRLIEKITNKKMKIYLNSKIPDERCIWADNSNAKKTLKFKPKIDIKKGLSITYEYISKSN